jgi:hypothetical protein
MTTSNFLQNNDPWIKYLGETIIGVLIVLALIKILG